MQKFHINLYILNDVQSIEALMCLQIMTNS